MNGSLRFDYIVRSLREFFQYQKGFIEVPAQSRLSILAACEQPKTLTEYKLGGMIFPLPQTGQMWLEHELLKSPEWPGCFCVTTSYRDEPNPIEGRHLRIFPMFEFESHGDFSALQKLERELLEFLGFDEPISLQYRDVCARYRTETIEAEHELQLNEEFGHSISLEHFPEYTHPFWNMKSQEGIFDKIDILLHGMETIGSAERETDKDLMYKRFHTLENGEYCSHLFKKFGRDRVLKELEEYLAIPMFPRFGGGIGLTRLDRALQLQGIYQNAKSSFALV